MSSLSVSRNRSLTALREALWRSPVVALLGARQVGKTTLARELFARWEGPRSFFDLEDPDDLARLAEPKLMLSPLTGLVVMDEIQRRPDLFPLLRVLADRPGTPARFLILGSASPALLRQGSETLAGRLAYLTLEGFALDETGVQALPTLWRRGGFPRSFLADSEAESMAWRRDFVRSFLERDIPQLGVRVPALTLHRFWQMIAHYHGQVWNGAELARAFGVAHSTVRHYLDILSGALVVRQLAPWFENLGKRQVRAQKVYLADSGLLHALLGIEAQEALEGHPKVGASWEGFAIREILRWLDVPQDQCYFWATHAGAELDLLIFKDGHRLGFEIKRTTTPRLTPAIRSALRDLRLDRLTIVHAGEHAFPMSEQIEAVPLAELVQRSPREAGMLRG